MADPPAHRRAILVVDDDVDIREALCQLLESEDWPVEGASNGREALDLLRAQPGRIGLIVLDLMMPMLNGWEFMLEKNGDAQLAPIPVLVISASADASATGATGFLPKPLNLDRLLSFVARHALPAA